MKNKMMRKIFVMLMAVLIVFSGCSYLASAEYNKGTIYQVKPKPTYDDKQNKMPGNPPNQNNKEELEAALKQLVDDGELTESEATALKNYLEKNRPGKGSTGQNKGAQYPIRGAVEAGVITQSQAQKLGEILRPTGENKGPGNNKEVVDNKGADKDQGPGNNQGTGNPQGPRNQVSSITIKEAQAIEAKLLKDTGYSASKGGYPIVDTGQEEFYSDRRETSEPDKDDDFYGQDGNYEGNTPDYTDNGDGTIADNVTGLIWQQDPGEKMTWEEAVENVEDFELAGYDDWRLPTIKELYSLIQFNGVTGMSVDSSTPYIDTDYFEFKYGDVTGERFIDSQYATSTIYESTTMNRNTTMFGVNFADGRIKGYGIGSKKFYVMYVRGNANYGMNDFVDNGDGTITDLSTGLMWIKYDSGHFEAGQDEDGKMDWEESLEWAEGLDYAGYEDWKLPDAKELQSIVDYNRSLDTTNSAAIDPMFDSTSIVDVNGEKNYPFYWTSTTHLDGRNLGSSAVYLAFGEALGYFDDEFMDVHGAGAQRSDPKTGDREDYPQYGKGPQGDTRAVFNFVRAVRIAD